MERRDLLKLIATATGTALVGGKALAYDIAVSYTHLTLPTKRIV